MRFKHFPWTYCADSHHQLDFDGALGFRAKDLTLRQVALRRRGDGGCAKHIVRWVKRRGPSVALDFPRSLSPFKDLLDLPEVPCASPSRPGSSLSCVCLDGLSLGSAFSKFVLFGFGVLWTCLGLPRLLRDLSRRLSRDFPRSVSDGVGASVP